MEQSINDWQFQPYDILQIRLESGWVDYATLRDSHEADIARRAVKTGRCPSVERECDYRIVRHGPLSKSGTWVR